jgi:hypothetical protein
MWPCRSSSARWPQHLQRDVGRDGSVVHRLFGVAVVIGWVVECPDKGRVESGLFLDPFKDGCGGLAAPVDNSFNSFTGFVFVAGWFRHG